MSRNLLSMVKEILEKIDSDDVDSITDTPEAIQIAGLVRQTFYDIVEEYGLPSRKTLRGLVALGDVTKPNYLKLPDEVRTLYWFKYDTKLALADPSVYTDVTYMTPDAFVALCNARDSTDIVNNLVVAVTADVNLTIDIVSPPRYWTSFDEVYIVCDAVDTGIDATLQASKTQAYVEEGIAFTLSDTFIAPLSENLQNLLYRTAENEAYSVYKQAVNPVLDQKAKWQRIRAQRHKHRTRNGENFLKDTPNYGRR